MDILTSKNSAGPSNDWLDMVRTSRARNKIKRFFKRRDREQNIDKGRDIIDHALLDAGYNPRQVLTPANIDRVLAKRQLTSADDMYAAVGFGELQPEGVVNRLTEAIREGTTGAGGTPPESRLSCSMNPRQLMITTKETAKANTMPCSLKGPIT